MDYSRNIKNKISDWKISRFTIFCTIVLIGVVAFFLTTKDEGGLEAIKWMIAIMLLSIAARPLLFIDNLKLWDDGFALSFSLGLALSFMLSFVISALHFALFDSTLLVISACTVLAAGKVLAHVKNGYTFTQKSIEKYIWGCTLFAVLFVFAFWVIGFNGLVDSGTENYMDYGFVKSIFRQKELAPYDMWFSNERLNYYYLGQAATAFLTRLSFTTPEYGYNLMLATFWSMLFVMVFEIVYGVVLGVLNANKELISNSRIAAIAGGIVAGCMSCLAANGEWLLNGLIIPIINKIRGIQGEAYWFPSPTTYISVALMDPDNGKTEFPAYSAILGDLHAHVVNVLFVMPLVALLLDYAFSKSEKKSYKKLVLVSILLGLYKGTNYWDFVIYFVITGAIVVFCDLYNKGINRLTIAEILVKALMVTLISTIVILPFTLNFTKVASHIMLAENHSPLFKLLILWGFPIFTTIGLIVYLFALSGRRMIFPNASRFGLLAFMLCTIGLVITPEVLYVLDIYGIENARFNTMFKFTYQAFVLFSIIIGIAAGIAFARRSLFFVLITTMTIFLSSYTAHAISDWMGNVFNADLRKGISATAKLYDDADYEFEMQAASIIDEDKRRVVNIVEGAADSYTHGCALSVLTGACTPAGWFVHEWLWRDDSSLIAQRTDEVRNFYESGDISYCSDFLKRYDVDYIFVGPRENDKYMIDLNGFLSLGDIVLENDNEYGEFKLIKIK